MISHTCSELLSKTVHMYTDKRCMATTLLFSPSSTTNKILTPDDVTVPNSVTVPNQALVHHRGRQGSLTVCFLVSDLNMGSHA